ASRRAAEPQRKKREEEWPQKAPKATKREKREGVRVRAGAGCPPCSCSPPLFSSFSWLLVFFVAILPLLLRGSAPRREASLRPGTPEAADCRPCSTPPAEVGCGCEASLPQPRPFLRRWPSRP